MAQGILKSLVDGIIALGLGGGDPVYPGPRPHGHQGACTTVIIYGGAPTTELPARQPRAQIMVYYPERDAGVAWARIDALFNALKSRSEWALTDWTVHLVEAVQEPYQLDVENHMIRLVFNVQLYVTEAI